MWKEEHSRWIAGEAQSDAAGAATGRGVATAANTADETRHVERRLLSGGAALEKMRLRKAGQMGEKGVSAMIVGVDRRQEGGTGEHGLGSGQAETRCATGS